MEEESEWKKLLEDIGIWMELQFVLNSRREKEIWQYIVGQAAHLEYLAVVVLWTHAGRPFPFEKYKPHITLGQAACEIEGKKEITLKPRTVQILKDVAILRNGVAHRDALRDGVTIRGNEGRGEYRGRYVFSDPGGLRQLVDDASEATEDISAWYRMQPGQTR